MSEQPTTSRVLVVSDMKDAGRFLGRVLEDSGLEIVTCSSDDVAIELASSFPAFDAVLGDSIGEPVVRRVRNLADPDRAATPIVILAPYHADDTESDAVMTGGATSYLTRPIVEHDLVGAIRAVLPDDDSTPEQTGSTNADER